MTQYQHLHISGAESLRGEVGDEALVLLCLHSWCYSVYIHIQAQTVLDCSLEVSVEQGCGF